MYKINILSKKAIIFFILLVVVIISVTSFTYAYWGGDAAKRVDGTNSPQISLPTDLTYRYMIFKVNNLTTDYYLKYSDNGYFIPYDLYGEGLASVENAAVTSVELILYTGALGEYETLKIPGAINIKLKESDPDTFSANVTSIDLHMAEMMNTKDLFKNVEIPASVTNIKGASFSACNNLLNVFYLGTTWPTISSESFRNPTPTFYLNGVAQTEITRA